MPADGQEVIADSKNTVGPVGEARSTRAATDAKTAVDAKGTTSAQRRRRRNRPRALSGKRGRAIFPFYR